MLELKHLRSHNRRLKRRSALIRIVGLIVATYGLTLDSPRILYTRLPEAIRRNDITFIKTNRPGWRHDMVDKIRNLDIAISVISNRIWRVLLPSFFRAFDRLAAIIGNIQLCAINWCSKCHCERIAKDTAGLYYVVVFIGCTYFILIMLDHLAPLRNLAASFAQNTGVIIVCVS